MLREVRWRKDMGRNELGRRRGVTGGFGRHRGFGIGPRLDKIRGKIATYDISVLN